MRCSRRSGCSPPCGTRTARSPSTGSPRARRRRPDYDEAQLREETGLLPRVSPIGTRRRSSPASGTSRRSRSPASTRRASRTPPTPSCRPCGCGSARGSRPVSATRSTTRCSRRTCGRTRRSARSSSSRTPTWGSRSSSTPSGWAVAEAKATMAEAYGAEAVEMGVRRVDPVHRRPRRAVPGRPDPDHRRRGPRLAGAQPERVPAPRHVPARDPRRDLPACSHEQQHAESPA